MNPADIAVVIGASMMIFGFCSTVLGLMGDHHGQVWVGIFGICLGLWVLLGTIVVSALFGLS